MQVHPAPRFVVQRPEAVGFLAVEIELGRILNSQHYRVLSHALLGALPVRGKNALPRHLIVAKEAACCARFAPVVACLRDARRRFRRKSFHHCSRSLVEASIAKIQSSKFLIRPALRYLGQCVTQSQRVNAISRKFTSPICNSLNFNDFFGQARGSCGLMYNDMASTRRTGPPPWSSLVHEKIAPEWRPLPAGCRAIWRQI